MLQWFIDGGFFMYPILVCLFLGLAISFERLYFLHKVSVNNKRLQQEVFTVLRQEGVEKAAALCEQNSGPLSAIFLAALSRHKKGIDRVEKSITEAGAGQIAALERGLIWLSTIISLSPLLGFTGTVQGMIFSFDAIKRLNDIYPSIVAGGISVALLTTLFGLIVAMIIQVFHNYFVSRIDRLILNMEENSAALIEQLTEI
ncbi:MotA/TolQ/ExbB proton channel family protein [candidate division KSB1 bacterium]|nr:MotA/TolQ/ExbB proton channel family protein [candidate division KSB1 bacterium]